ncbi:hypothetical protein F4779DRAFT_561173 [Xylariaceae sp. FL0662B]|nr:hypothetical protein F4779DRAFT_561173 [Xylariaceae sp. FL0662B]
MKDFLDIRTYARTYLPNKITPAPSFFVDFESALFARVTHHGLLNAMQEYVSNKEVRRLQRLQVNHKSVAAMQRTGCHKRCVRQPRMEVAVLDDLFIGDEDLQWLHLMTISDCVAIPEMENII